MSERIAILGGTFDPIHIGHLAIAEEVRWHLGARVFFVPAARQPFKANTHTARAADRLAMVRLAIAGNPAFAMCDLEVRRGGHSYTVDTVMTLRDEYPAAEFTFVAGADIVLDLHRWYQIERLLGLCRFAIITRPGYAADLQALHAVLPAAYERVSMIEGPSLDISATTLRDRLRRGAPVRYQIPEPVLEYIDAHGLYRTRD